MKEQGSTTGLGKGGGVRGSQVGMGREEVVGGEKGDWVQQGRLGGF